MAMVDLDELERRIACATPGEWEVDSERNEDCSPKHHDYFIGSTGSAGKWVTLFDSVNSDQKMIEEEYDEDYHYAWDAVGNANAASIVALHNSAAAMIAEIRELRGENARLREAVVDLADNIDDWDGVSGITEAVIDTARAALGEPQ